MNEYSLFKFNARVLTGYIFWCYAIFIYPLHNASLPSGGMVFIGRFVLFFLLALYFFSINVRRLPLKYHDYFIVIFSLYTLISLLVSFVINSLDIAVVLKELLYSFLPLFLYLAALLSDAKDLRVFINSYILSFVISSVLGLAYDFDLLEMPMFLNVALHSNSLNFGSFYNEIIFGSLAQLTFAMILFDVIKLKYYKGPLLFLSLFLVLITLQRSAYFGVILSSTLFFLYRVKSPSLIHFLITAISFYLLYHFFNDSIFYAFFLQELHDFQLNHALSARAHQAQIFIGDDFFSTLFGKGFSAFSINNPDAALSMMDANYFRILNELGIFGFFLFLAFFISSIFSSFFSRSPFKIYLLMYLLVAFYFNRILWSLPLAFIFYYLLGSRLLCVRHQ